MAKDIVFECVDCGTNFPRWQGQCTQCQAWNSLVESKVQKPAKKEKIGLTSTSKPLPLQEVEAYEHTYISTGLEELDVVLSGGLVHGSVTLLGGEPGIGKSTLGLQVAIVWATAGKKVLYISGEESLEQVHLRASRLGPVPATLLAYTETNMAKICDTMATEKPDLVILDSVQVVQHPELSGIEGSVAQVRHCANAFITQIKQKGLIGLMIGHITKDGHLAGPKVLEHMVDVILYFEGQKQEQHRILRCFKNRYGTTHEIGIFEMKETGLDSITQPADFFLDSTSNLRPGSAVSAVIEGSRAFLVEVQALVAPTSYGMAKRDVVGVNIHRANLLIAALEKNCGIPLSSKDIFLNIIGGLKIQEPSLDLAIVLAIFSSLSDKPLPEGLCAVGEIGLTGEIRTVSRIQSRLKELKKMGFNACFIPEKAKDIEVPEGLKVIPISHIAQTLTYLRQEVSA